MRILVSNDDGVYSPGIAALARAASEFGEVRVVAPDVEQSSAGHSITVHPTRSPPADGDPRGHRGLPRQRHSRRLRRARHVPVGEGRRRPLGDQPGPEPRQRDVALGHARRGEAGDVARRRGIALSAPVVDEQVDLSTIEPWLHRVLEVVLDESCPRLINVNFPRNPRGLRWTAQAVDRYDGKVVPGEDPRGRDPSTGSPSCRLDRHREGTDLWAVENDLVSLTRSGSTSPIATRSRALARTARSKIFRRA